MKTNEENRVRIVFQPMGLRVEVPPALTLLDAAREAGAGLVSECGGKGTCGRCRVRLHTRGAVSDPNGAERKRLGDEEILAGLRLACQARAYDSATVTIPPQSMTAPQRIQMEGDGEIGDWDPPTEICDLVLAEPSTEDPRGDWERLADGLAKVIGHVVAPPHLSVLRNLGRTLRESEWRVRVGLRGTNVTWVLPGGTPALGLAVDVGTTKVASWLMNLESGEILASAGLMNAQIAYGEDVMSRIAAVTEDGAKLDLLHRLVLSTVNELARTVCEEASKTSLGGNPASACEEKFRPEHIVEGVIVGNTVMHHLFLGLPVEPLGFAPFTPAVIAPLECRAGELGLDINENANIYFPPGVSGFIGSDHVAMMFSRGAGTKQGVVLGVDVGTNTEISLIVGERAVSCSASSGPAFEGAHVEHGMRASQGAIEGVKILDGEAALEVHTVGGGAPMGFCGSGILDAVAELKRHGVISWHGAIDPASPLVRPADHNHDGRGHEVLIVQRACSGHGRDITIGRKDIGGVQLAKAAIRSGIELLMQRMGIGPDDVEEVIVAGAFGAMLNLENALYIGLFPPIAPERFRNVGNAAGTGARAMLLSKQLREESVRLAASLEHYELTAAPSFRAKFIGSLCLGNSPHKR